MSIQREVEAGDLTKIPATKSDKVARLAMILDRAATNARLLPSNLPDDMTFQWMPDDPTETTRMELLGFVDGSKYVSNPTHQSGSGIAKVGDVRLWVIPKSEHKLIEEAQEELKRRKHGDKKRQIEENNLLTESQSSGPHLSGVSESNIEEVGASEILAATSPFLTK